MKKNVTAYIYPKGTSERNIFTTESNIQNLVGVHEILGHGMLGLKHDGMKPDKLFHLQKTHRTWGKTTIGFKIYETEI